MTRKIHLLALAALALTLPAMPSVAFAQQEGGPGNGVAAPAPAKSAPLLRVSPTNTPQRWLSASDKAAAAVVEALGLYAKVQVAPAATDSEFERALHEQLVNALNAKGMFVTEAPGPGVHVVHVRAKGAPRRSVDSSVKSIAEQMARQVTGAALPAPAGVMAVTSAEISVTTTVQADGVYLVRNTDTFEADRSELSLYNKSAPMLRIVGEK